MPLFLVGIGCGAKPHTTASFENHIHGNSFNFTTIPKSWQDIASDTTTEFN